MADDQEQPKEIPGFYYDSERKRYFRIQQAHQAPQGSRYTTDQVRSEMRKKLKVKHRKSEPCNLTTRTRRYGKYVDQQAGVSSILRTKSQRGKEIDHTHRIQPRPIQHSRLSRDMLAGIAGVHREHHTEAHSLRAVPSQAFAHGLQQNAVIIGKSCQRYQQYRSEKTSAHVADVAYDSCTRNLVVGFRGQATTLMSCGPVQLHPNYVRQPGPDQLQYTQPIAMLQSPVSSLHITPSRTLVTTAYGGEGARPAINLSRLMEPQGADGQSLEPGVMVSFHPHTSDTIHTSAVSPFATPGEDILLLGLDNNAGIIRSTATDWLMTSTYLTPTSVLSTTFQSPTTVALALRNQTVHLWDIRTDKGVSRFRHGSPITSVRCGRASHSLIVAGLQDYMASYDLRMLRNDVKAMDRDRFNHLPKRERRRREYRRDLPCSRPLFLFDYANYENVRLGMDVEREFGLVVAAQDDGTLAMYSTESGERIEGAGMRTGAAGGNLFDGGVRFFEDGEGRKGVLAGRGSRVEWFVW